MKRSAEAKSWQRFYKTRQWERIRAAQLLRQPLCERHLKTGEIVAANTVHHVNPHRGDWNLFILGPFESLCSHCHSGPTQSEEVRGAAFSTVIGADGFPLDPNHPFNR